MAGSPGRSGRRAKPAAAHILRGTFRPDRHGDDATPEPPIGAPKPLKPLSGDAKAEWNRMVESLGLTKTLSTVDRHVLFQYCEMFGETEELKASYWRLRKASSQMLKAAKGLESNDLVKALSEITKIEHEIGRLTVKLRQNRLGLKGLLVEFGLTPSARTRVKQLGGGAERPLSKVDQFRQRGGSGGRFA